MAAEATLLAHASPVLKVRPLPLAAGLLEALQSESPRSDGGSTPSPTAKPGDDYSPPLEAALLADGQCCVAHLPGSLISWHPRRAAASCAHAAESWL